MGAFVRVAAALAAVVVISDARMIYRTKRQSLFGDQVRPGDTNFGKLPIGNNSPVSSGGGSPPDGGIGDLRLNDISGPVGPLPSQNGPSSSSSDPVDSIITPTSSGQVPPGFAAGGGLPNPYDPYGPFRGGFGLGTSKGMTALGTGWREPEYYGFDWPNNGLQVQKGVDVPVFGHNVARYDESNLYVRPDGSVAQYAFGDNQGLTVLGSGYKDGWQGKAGINGYDLGDRFTVPVLGTNVVDVNDRSGFDLSKMKFSSGKEQQYGPIGLTTGGTQFESPWLGQLVQRSMWNGALKEAGYDPEEGSELPPGNIPGVPVVG